MLLGNALGRGSRPAFRWLVALIAVSSAVLVPWAAYLAISLPASVSARHWPVAWTGLDVVMAAGCLVLTVVGWRAAAACGGVPAGGTW